MTLKTTAFSIAKIIGCFNLASYLTSDNLSIICYHGFSLNDEHLFRPGLFLSAELFEQRMRWLKKNGYQTISLDEAVQRMHNGSLNRKDLVITIDDGFYSTFSIAVPILKSFGFTATIYVTTHYVVNNNPIFNICVDYLFWKTMCKSVELSDLLPGLEGFIDPKGGQARDVALNLIEFGETQLNERERMTFVRELAGRLEVDFDELASARILNLMNEAELTDLVDQGFDIQLHTHRHRLPENDIEINRELSDNRAVLEAITKRPLHHFCYPSGKWSRGHWSALEAEGIKTATLAEPGVNSFRTPPYAMPRFLDFQSTPKIVFEAEVTGFSNLLRQAFRRHSR